MTTPIPPTTPTTPATGTQASIASAQKSLGGDQQTFLKLLTAQLKAQNPLSPVDSNQFTQQLVAMTGVQQQITTNTLLQQLVNNQSGFADPVSLIGKTATVNSPDATLQGGKADWLFSLGGTAASATIKVLDANGNVVAQSTPGSLSPGEQSFNWDGKNLLGAQQGDGGTYTLQITATDASGAAIASQVYQRGPVTSIQENNGTPLVGLNGGFVPLSSVTSVTASA
jgi:flagellar basal-body rod modification protein FlgD